MGQLAQKLLGFNPELLWLLVPHDYRRAGRSWKVASVGNHYIQGFEVECFEVVLS